MTDAIEFRSDSASLDQLVALLQGCDASFIPPLSNRVDLAAYARKIAAHALRLEAWQGTAPAALLAMYCNEQRTGTAYITSVSVLPVCARRGIASALLSRAIGHARAAGMRCIELEVDPNNHAARRLYQAHGFRAVSAGPPIHMNLDLSAEQNVK